MDTIQKEILEEFYVRLGNADGFTEGMIKKVRDLFDANKKPKPGDLVKVFSGSSEGSLL
jgi:hypothetical protein